MRAMNHYKHLMRKRFERRYWMIDGTERAFAILAFVWLNLSMLPCAMAFGGDVSGSDGAAGLESMPAHHGHHAHTTDQQGNSHEADCCDLVEVSVDDRSPSVEKKAAGDVTIAMLPNEDARAAVFAHRLQTSSDPPYRSSGAPRLHVVNCVYLD